MRGLDHGDLTQLLVRAIAEAPAAWLENCLLRSCTPGLGRGLGSPPGARPFCLPTALRSPPEPTADDSWARCADPVAAARTARRPCRGRRRAGAAPLVMVTTRTPTCAQQDIGPQRDDEPESKHHTWSLCRSGARRRPSIRRSLLSAASNGHVASTRGGCNNTPAGEAASGAGTLEFEGRSPSTRKSCPLVHGAGSRRGGDARQGADGGSALLQSVEHCRQHFRHDICEDADETAEELVLAHCAWWLEILA
jgi:hypothetical protein